MRRSERLSLWESWREAPERARTLTEKRKRSDSIVLTKESAHRRVAALTCRACPLRHACGVPLPGLRLPASASLPLASCWPRPQQLLPVSATGGGRRRCSQRERPWQAGSLPTGRPRPDKAQKGGPCYRGQRLLDKRSLSSCRCPGQRSTTAHETNKLCSFSGNLTDMPKAPPLGELARSA